MRFRYLMMVAELSEWSNNDVVCQLSRVWCGFV